MISPEQFSGWILLLLMSILAVLATAFVSGPKYDGKGIYWLTVNAWFRGNKEYSRWLRDNSVYHWCCVLIAFLCPTVLSLAPSFSDGNMIVRPELMIWINPFLWLAILMSYRWFFKRIK